MLRSTRLSLFCLSIAPLLVAQTIEPEKLREDFRILRSALEEGHPGIYRYTPKAELDSVFDATAARLDRPMTALEFYRVLAPVVAALKCGHTSMGFIRGAAKEGDSTVSRRSARTESQDLCVPRLLWDGRTRGG